LPKLLPNSKKTSIIVVTNIMDKALNIIRIEFTKFA
jgi:hypothetical protein